MSHGPTDEQALAVLAKHDITTSAVLATETGEEWADATRALHRLVRHGKAVRVGDAHGFRGWRLAPTPGRKQNTKENPDA